MRCAESGSGYIRISSVSAVILDRCNAVAGEQVPDALLSLGVLAPINKCQVDRDGRPLFRALPRVLP
jgi:hypothetical protein